MVIVDVPLSILPLYFASKSDPLRYSDGILAKGPVLPMRYRGYFRFLCGVRI